MGGSTGETPTSDSSNTTHVGPFRVSAAKAEIDAFCRETGWTQADMPSGFVPHTFPMRWLSSLELRRLIEARLRQTGGVAIHESQSFAYQRRLAADQDYLVTADVDQQENPRRLILRVAVAAEAGEPLLRIETILRIVGAEPVP